MLSKKIVYISIFLCSALFEHSYATSIPKKNITPETYYCCHHYQQTQEPKTILENTITAIAGTGIAVIGTLFASVGIHILCHAFNELYEDTDTIERIIDGCGGILFTNFGLIFSLIGISTTKESIVRIYKIIKKIPLPEEV